MTRSNRLTAGVVGVGLTLALVGIVHPDCMAWAGLKRQVVDGPYSFVTPASQQSMILYQRIDAKNRVADRLLQGEMTLVEAAAWFRLLNSNPPDMQCDYRSTWPGKSDGEKLCRQVLVWASQRLEDNVPASQADDTIGRLEAELAALLARGDEVKLPW